MSELDELRQQVVKHRRTVRRANTALNDAVLAAYRAERLDGTPQFTLAQIGEALGVTRQRASQVVREAAGLRAK